MSSLYRTALNELAVVFDRVNDAEVDKALGMIAKAKRIVVFGGGRERLQIMGFAMRLYHMGLPVAVEGDMTTPPVGKGDLFMVIDPGALAGSDNLAAQAAFLAAAEDTLLGEDLFAAGAYLGKSSAHVASLRAQDVLRVILIVVILLGVTAKTLGVLP